MVDCDEIDILFSLEPPKGRKCDYDSEVHNGTPFVVIKIDDEYINLCINHLNDLASDLDYKGRFTSFVIDEFSITGSWEGYCNFCDDEAHTEFVMDDSRIKMCEDHVNYVYYTIYGFYRYIMFWW